MSADRAAAPTPDAESLHALAAERLVWIDLEMTGLDTDRHVIVEIGVLVTDADLQVIGEGFDVVVHQPPEALAEMDDFVRRMHTRSGLLPAIEASTLSLEDAGAQALDYIKSLVPAAGVAPMCGNSIGTDRRFLAAQLRELDDYLHYRSVDVSSFKELCRRWYPDVYAERPDKGETHRALEDITESIAELQFYRANMLRAPDASDVPDVPEAPEGTPGT